MPIAFNPPYIDDFLRYEMATREWQAQQKAEAIRWEGAQEFDTLVRSGIAPQDAYARTAPKLFYNEPRALAAAVGQTGVGTGEGRIMTDPSSGRQFIVQPSGRISAVPQRWTGSTTVMGPGGQVYKIPLSEQELANAPRTPTPPPVPQVVPIPGGSGQMIIQPSGTATRVPPAPGELARTKDVLAQARALAEPKLKEYQTAKNEVLAGNMRPFWDWTGLAEPYSNKMARLEGQLADLGFDTKGQVLPGSRLAGDLGLGTPAPGPTPQTVPAPTMTAPAQTMPLAPPVSPSGRPYRFFQQPRAQPTAGGTGPFVSPGLTAAPLVTAPAPTGRVLRSGAVVAPPVQIETAPPWAGGTAQGTAGAVTSPAAPARVGAYVGPNEELRKVKGRLVVFDKNTHKALRYAD